MNRIILGENLAALRTLADESVDLIYIDPPFNTGERQERTRIRVERAAEGGDREGFQGRRYHTTVLGTSGFDDRFDDFLGFLEPRISEGRRVLKPEGSFFLHLDYREAHYAKLLLDALFGRRSFMNEIIWAYDFGGRSRKRWPAKHDTIFWYAKDPSNCTFNYEEIDRIPYMAPGLVGPEKARRGKTPTDVWWHTIVPTHGAEKTGYATQKPLGLLTRIVKVHTRPGDVLLDYFAGSGTLGDAAARLGREFILIDQNSEAYEIMKRRLADAQPRCERLAVRNALPTGQQPG